MADDHDSRGPEKKQGRHDPSRRRFLKGVGIVGAGAAVADHLLLNHETEAAEAAGAGTRPVGGTLNVALDVNGQKRSVSVEPRTTLLNALRKQLDPPLTGAKLVCDAGTCGACTVLLDGRPVYACMLLALDAVGRKVTTVEGLTPAEGLSVVQQAFVEKDASMCGFCTSGFVVSVHACLERDPAADLGEIQRACSGNLCRCGTYPHVFEAALAAGERLRAGGKK